MAYEPTEWKNREVEKPRTFQLQNNPDGTVTLIPKEGNIIEPGTPIIADNMNKIETGIEEAHILAEQAFQSASDGKEVIAAAITGKGVPSSGSDTFSTLASKIEQIETDITGDATAIASDLLAGKTAYAKGQKLTGTLPNVGKQIITPGTANKTITKGVHDGTGYVAGDPDLIPANIKKDVDIFGVKGSLIDKIPGSVTIPANSASIINLGVQLRSVVAEYGGYPVSLFISPVSNSQMAYNYNSFFQGSWPYSNHDQIRFSHQNSAAATINYIAFPK